MGDEIEGRLEDGLVEGKVAVVTGAGRGIGREHALLLARHGASIVVNDLGADMAGSGTDAGPANSVVDEIEAMGGAAIVNGADVSDFAAAGEMIEQAIDTFGRLDILINNAGILRDRMLFNMSESDWDQVIGVHLKGTFAPTQHAAAHWRRLSKRGEDVSGRVINTSSPSGIYGNVGQTNYGAAKAGLAAFTVIAAQELHRIGVTVNAIAPAALSRMTEQFVELVDGEVPAEVAEAQSPKWISPIAVWLCSDEAAEVTGRVFDVRGDRLGIAEGWTLGPVVAQSGNPADLGPVVADLMARARGNSDMRGRERRGPGFPPEQIEVV